MYLKNWIYVFIIGMDVELYDCFFVCFFLNCIYNRVWKSWVGDDKFNYFIRIYIKIIEYLKN